MQPPLSVCSHSVASLNVPPSAPSDWLHVTLKRHWWQRGTQTKAAVREWSCVESKTLNISEVVKTSSVSAGIVLLFVFVVTGCNFSYTSTRNVRRGRGSETAPGCSERLDQILIVSENAAQWEYRHWLHQTYNMDLLMYMHKTCLYESAVTLSLLVETSVCVMQSHECHHVNFNWHTHKNGCTCNRFGRSLEPCVCQRSGVPCKHTYIIDVNCSNWFEFFIIQ